MASLSLRNALSGCKAPEPGRTADREREREVYIFFVQRSCAEGDGRQKAMAMVRRSETPSEKEMPESGKKR